MQQSSEILMLNTELKTLRKQYKQLIDIHTRYKSQEHSFKSQEHSSTATQTDQVAKYCNCFELQMILTILCLLIYQLDFSLYITLIMLQKLSSCYLYTDTWLKVKI